MVEDEPARSENELARGADAVTLVSSTEEGATNAPRGTSWKNSCL